MVDDSKEGPKPDKLTLLQRLGSLAIRLLGSDAYFELRSPWATICVVYFLLTSAVAALLWFFLTDCAAGYESLTLSLVREKGGHKYNCQSMQTSFTQYTNYQMFDFNFIVTWNYRNMENIELFKYYDTVDEELVDAVVDIGGTPFDFALSTDGDHIHTEEELDKFAATKSLDYISFALNFTQSVADLPRNHFQINKTTAKMMFWPNHGRGQYKMELFQEDGYDDAYFGATISIQSPDGVACSSAGYDSASGLNCLPGEFIKDLTTSFYLTATHYMNLAIRRSIMSCETEVCTGTLSAVSNTFALVPVITMLLTFILLQIHLQFNKEEREKIAHYEAKLLADRAAIQFLLDAAKRHRANELAAAKNVNNNTEAGLSATVDSNENGAGGGNVGGPAGGAGGGPSGQNKVYIVNADNSARGEP